MYGKDLPGTRIHVYTTIKHVHQVLVNYSPSSSIMPRQHCQGNHPIMQMMMFNSCHLIVIRVTYAGIIDPCLMYIHMYLTSYSVPFLITAKRIAILMFQLTANEPLLLAVSEVVTCKWNIVSWNVPLQNNLLFRTYYL